MPAKYWASWASESMPTVITHQDGRCKCYLFTPPKRYSGSRDYSLQKPVACPRRRTDHGVVPDGFVRAANYRQPSAGAGEGRSAGQMSGREGNGMEAQGQG